MRLDIRGPTPSERSRRGPGAGRPADAAGSAQRATATGPAQRATTGSGQPGVGAGLDSRAPVVRACAAAIAIGLAACANQPPTPEWQLNASSGLDRVREAYFEGDARAEADEFARVRRDVSRTASPALLARAELVRCALRAASLVVEECVAFEALRADADPAERAYAAYLRGQVAADHVALLPEPHRPLARAGGPATDLAALDRMRDPLSRLVGASVLLRTGRGTPGVVARAVDAASAQGWSRPLRAWLQVQLRQAQAAGDTAAAERIGRRIELVSAPPSRTPSP